MDQGGARPAPRLVEVGSEELEDYPISASERLDSHFFVPFNLKRWRSSELRRRAYGDPEVGFYAMELFFIAQDETPLGTLPADDDALAFLLRMPVAHWRDLCSRTLSPLYRWGRVRCDNDEVRLAHPVVTRTALEAIEGRRRNDTKNADDRARKRLNSIAKILREDIPGGEAWAANEAQLNNISEAIEMKYPGGSATRKRIVEALEGLKGRYR